VWAKCSKTAFKQDVAAIIVCHHPNGNPTPSPEDVAVTRQFVDVGRLLGVEVLGHLVIRHGRWVSLCR
jgi:DNA repair protein RadC